MVARPHAPSTPVLIRVVVTTLKAVAIVIDVVGDDLYGRGRNGRICGIAVVDHREQARVLAGVIVGQGRAIHRAEPVAVEIHAAQRQAVAVFVNARGRQVDRAWMDIGVFVVAVAPVVREGGVLGARFEAGDYVNDFVARLAALGIHTANGATQPPQSV